MHIVDRRLNPRGKSLENRQRFLRRMKGAVQQAVKRSLQNRNIRDVLDGGEISLPIDGMAEPSLRRGDGGTADHILPGNRAFVEGDIIPRPPSARGGKPKDAGEGDGEDGFRFVLTREEFLDVFLDDLELPDLAKRRLAETEEETPVRAGYSVSGSPSNIAVGRTTRLAMMRRVALHRPRREEIEALQRQIEECEDDESRLAFESKLKSLTEKSRRIPYIDPLDVRYRRFENEPKPVAKAVMFCLMDVSGSMSEHMKDLAKRFYLLLYLFLSKRYKKVEIVFIRHTDKAEEVDEETFFYGPATGGTLVSSALVAMRRIIAARFDPAEWNIYGAQASDGDNAHSDGNLSGQLLREILPLCQYFAYIEVGEEGGDSSVSRSPLWMLYDGIRSELLPLSMRKVCRRGEIFPVFHDLFQKRDAQSRVTP
ncbi:MULTISPECIES: YeaH/YhbH family protein [unclassified Rhizobium]|uniref:YeaH/YhbH family protein n=1 Tax=unclassified Rhizobium TaxID=2613769 RepID=UPI001A98D975|nr:MULTISPECIES: YeaH/YhbH family protein [unclassified Rhizobium]MBX5157801.1 YeaH/YhbH family protein [Rhizobium sp. NZLR8]MBX5170064.1 YeaH/YhbH family protein [Rhizobium sp. NZLR1b]MBX5184872.1 YeaH/YhbH family protein [Rhizobium sp. NZLR5]MBX5189725.1 YeaH/YhbH family protein [Rhizobium sp. NZLR3b]MBX5194993.1 YeaH/YhbH family protein [Rhizobium sp. NZLR10]